MSQIVNRIIEGGPVFTVPMVLIILTIIVLFALSLLGRRDPHKMNKLIGHLSLFAMVWGFLGSTIGLIQAFDAIESIDNVAKPIVAGGLKVALLSTVFGLFTFLIGRLAMFILTLKENQRSEVLEA